MKEMKSVCFYLAVISVALCIATYFHVNNVPFDGVAAGLEVALDYDQMIMKTSQDTSVNNVPFDGVAAGLEVALDYEQMIMKTSQDTCGGKVVPSFGCAKFLSPKHLFDKDLVTSNISGIVDNLPPSVDWRAKGAVTEVKNQCNCATAAIEGIMQIKKGTLYQLSPQELVDCDEGSQGCAVGYLDSAFRYIKKNKGLHEEVDYPYLATKGICRRDAKYSRFGEITGYNMVGLNEEYLQQAVANQPISVNVAESYAFRTYKGGIFTGPCDIQIPFEKNNWHSVTVVGYGTEPSGLKYWIIKNSWGKEWGRRRVYENEDYWWVGFMRDCLKWYLPYYELNRPITEYLA